ncbi:hypothetical protein Tco_1239496 [Tanacetum coccineum]
MIDNVTYSSSLSDSYSSMIGASDHTLEPHPTCFTLRIHHGGCFKFYLGRAYYEGKRSIVDMVLGKNLDIGLHALSCNDDVRFLSQFKGDHNVIEVYIARGCTKVYTYYNPKPTISSVENDEIHEDNDVVTSTYTQNVLKMLFFDMFPHHVDTSVDTQRFAKRLFLDTVPHVETQEDVVEESLNVEDYQLNDIVVDHTGEVNETVVEDSWRVEHSYDDVASTDKMDDDSYVYERSGEDEDSESQKMIVLIGNVPDFMFDENDLDVIDNEDFDSDSGEGCDIENIRGSKQKQLRKRRLQEDGVVNKHDFFVGAVQDALQKKCELNVSHIKALRAEEMVDVLIKGTTVKCQVGYPEDHNAPTRVFKYVCLGALKQGFKATGRELFGLDETFISGPFPREVLTVMGDDIDHGKKSNFTFISVRQKGTVQALAKVFPSAEHRYCLRHIHENMKKYWNGLSYMQMLCKCATTTIIQGFKAAMKELKSTSVVAHAWLS